MSCRNMMQAQLRRLLISAAVAATSACARPLIAQAAPPHAFGLDDLSHLRDASPIAIDPDCKHVLYVVTYFAATGPEKRQVHEIGVAGDGDRVLSLPEPFTAAGFMADGTTFAAWLGKYNPGDGTRGSP